MEPTLTCIACGAPLACEPEGDCWCKHEPVRLPMPGPDEPAGCYCPTCLRAKAAAAEAEATRP
jgi:hypothetical protein